MSGAVRTPEAAFADLPGFGRSDKPTDPRWYSCAFGLLIPQTPDAPGAAEGRRVLAALRESDWPTRSAPSPTA